MKNDFYIIYYLFNLYLSIELSVRKLVTFSIYKNKNSNFLFRDINDKKTRQKVNVKKMCCLIINTRQPER